MASTLLTGNDFVSNTNMVQVGQNGELSVDSARDSDYTVGIVSRDAFDFTSGNKSVRFVFGVSPDTTAARKGVYGKGIPGKFLAVVDNGSIVEWTGDSFDSTCPGAPNCDVLNQYACSTFYHADASSTHSIVKTGQVLGFAGDNSNGQITISTPETVESFACGENFTLVMRLDGTLEFIGDDHDGNISIPTECVTFNENNRPISVVAGEQFIAILTRDGVIHISGDGMAGTIDTDGEPIVQISAGEGHVVALTLSGNIYGEGNNSFGQSVDQAKKALKISASSNRSAMLCTDGKTYHWGEGISGTEECGSVPADSIIIDVIAGESFTVSVLKDRSIVVSGSTPSYMSDIVSNKIGDKRTATDTNDAYDMFPMLRDITGFNAFFGIQNDMLDQTFQLYTTSNNETKPIVIGRDSYQSVFQGLRGGFKGTILAKVDNMGDVCFDLTGSDYDPFSSSGHLPVSTNFITDDGLEKYEVIVSFGPLGKVIKFRKISGEYWSEMPFKHISIEETGFSAGRVAMYIRNARDFTLYYAEVTDELDTGLLPAEILYRDMDTAVLHTKAAELVVDIADAVETISDGVKKNADTILSLNSDYKTRLSDIFARLEALEGN
jgi:hypothetical protein